MRVKFLKAYESFKEGDTIDMLRSKIAELKPKGIVTDDPVEVNKSKVKKVVPTQKDEAVK